MPATSNPAQRDRTAAEGAGRASPAQAIAPPMTAEAPLRRERWGFMVLSASPPPNDANGVTTEGQRARRRMRITSSSKDEPGGEGRHGLAASPGH